MPEYPISIVRLRRILGRTGLLDSTKVRLTRASKSEVPWVPGVTFFGWVSVKSGQLVCDVRGRPVIKLTADALNSLESAVKTVGHELHHIKEILSGAGSNESEAERAAAAFWKRFVARSKRV